MSESLLLPSWLHSGQASLPPSGYRGPRRALGGKARSVLRAPPPAAAECSAARRRGPQVPPTAAQVAGAQPAVLASPPRQPGLAPPGPLHPLPGTAPRPGNWKGGIIVRYPSSLPRFTKLMTMSASLRKALSCALVSGDVPLPPSPGASRLLRLTGCADPGGGCLGWDAPAPLRGQGCRLSSPDGQSSSSSLDRELYRSSMKRGADFSRPGGGSPRGCCCGSAGGGGCWRPCKGRGR